MSFLFPRSAWEHNIPPLCGAESDNNRRGVSGNVLPHSTSEQGVCMSYWRGKRAVITGGSAGLGRALAGVLVEQGARVAIVARGAEQLERAAGELHGAGGNVLSVAADVTIVGDV